MYTTSCWTKQGLRHHHTSPITYSPGSGVFWTAEPSHFRRVLNTLKHNRIKSMLKLTMNILMVAHEHGRLRHEYHMYGVPLLNQVCACYTQLSRWFDITEKEGLQPCASIWPRQTKTVYPGHLLDPGHCSGHWTSVTIVRHFLVLSKHDHIGIIFQPSHLLHFPNST